MDYETAQTVFGSLAGGTFVGIDTLTAVKLTGGRRNPQQGRVQKRMTGAQVMVFSNDQSNAYERMVRRRLAEEGRDPDSFQLGPRAWGTRIAGTPFVEHKGQYYLETIFLRAGRVQYLLDGEPIDPELIQGLPERPESEAGQGGLDRKVVIRTFALDSIIGLRAHGVQWP
jgi:hypothetical protein